MLGDLVGSSRYFSGMICYTNDFLIASLYLIADVVLALSLAACALRVWAKRSEGFYLLPYQCRLVALCVLFLSLGYALEIVTLFQAVYRLEVVLRGAAAGLSVVVAFSCWSRR